MTAGVVPPVCHDESSSRVAALYVHPGGVYYGLPGVDPWDKARDARTYPGPHPVVAHPPCERWGRYWYGGPSCKERKKLGDDGGCFESALAAVRKWGGVLEHPEASLAWPAFGLRTPLRGGGWSVADGFTGPGLTGWTCCVEQGHYGHRARKATWLYTVRCDLPRLTWGRSSSSSKLDDGFHSKEERRMFTRPPKDMSPEWRKKRREWLARRELDGDKTYCAPGRLSHVERLSTPVPFRDLLLGIARSVLDPKPGPTPQSCGAGAP